MNEPNPTLLVYMVMIFSLVSMIALLHQRDLSRKTGEIFFSPARHFVRFGYEPAGIKGASIEELTVDGVFRQDVTSEWVWISLENCFSHLVPGVRMDMLSVVVVSRHLLQKRPSPSLKKCYQAIK